MKEFSLQLTTCEIEFESLTQLSLQLYVVFLRADRFPTLLQWFTIVYSFVTTSKGKADEFSTLISGQAEDATFLEKLKLLGNFKNFKT